MSALLVATGLGIWFGTSHGTQLDGPASEPLFAWPARGSLIHDAAFIDASEAVWRVQPPIELRPDQQLRRYPVPVGRIGTLYAGKLGTDTLALLDGVLASGRTAIAAVVRTGDLESLLVGVWTVPAATSVPAASASVQILGEPTAGSTDRATFYVVAPPGSTQARIQWKIGGPGAPPAGFTITRPLDLHDGVGFVVVAVPGTSGPGPYPVQGTLQVRLADGHWVSTPLAGDDHLALQLCPVCQ
jgi:hypothetical protein